MWILRVNSLDLKEVWSCGSFCACFCVARMVRSYKNGGCKFWIFSKNQKLWYFSSKNMRYSKIKKSKLTYSPELELSPS